MTIKFIPHFDAFLRTNGYAKLTRLAPLEVDLDTACRHAFSFPGEASLRLLLLLVFRLELEIMRRFDYPHRARLGAHYD